MSETVPFCSSSRFTPCGPAKCAVSNWMTWTGKRNLLLIPRSKGRKIEPYPLSPTVGEAIVRYLERVRPRSSYREIFLRVEAPIRPLTSAAVSSDRLKTALCLWTLL